MRIVIIFTQIIIVMCMDFCVQQTSYQDCINIKKEQCKWNGQYCQWSNNYLQGCEPTLSEKLCMKQFGKLDGTMAMCLFDKNCQNIKDKHFQKCTDKLSKFGCLSIINPDQLCKWEDDQCINLNQTELNNLNLIFQDLELSASVCSKITGFLIIHHTILQTLLGYYPDILSEAQQKVQIETGAEKKESITYQDSILKDNYLDQQKLFKWYTISTKLSISETKLNDFRRYGCVAQEILNENKFLQLFNLNGTIRGVNHVYCKYLNIHPINPVFTVFINSECQQITQNQLQDQTYINKNQLQCQDMSGLVCQRFQSFNNKCVIDYTKEYQCMNAVTITKNNDCQSLSGIATYYNCASVIEQYCYLDISNSKGECSSQCLNLTSQSTCEQNSQCKWLGDNLGNLSDSKLSQFIVCGPINGCNQLGLNKKYCQKISMNCYWNELNLKCQEVQFIEQLKCIDCNTIFCCSSINIYDQFCIWNADNCLNVKDQKLFSHFLSFSSEIIMNYNLCMSQKEQYNYYDLNTRTCKTQNINLYLPCIDFQDQDYNINNKACNNGINGRINKELCLALINSNTKWDSFNQRCVHITDKSIPCDQLKFVNPNLCKYGVVKDQETCLYDLEMQSCYLSSQDNIHCNTPGINQKQCLLNQNENCQWRDNKCNFLQVNLIVQYNCNEFPNVSSNVCRFTNQDFSCGYDFDNFGCKIITTSFDSCDLYINNQACFNSTSQCYFDNVQNRCLNAQNYLNIINCNSEYISYKTCIGITTINQNCYWGSLPNEPYVRCRSYQSQFQTNCNSYQDLSNLNTCTLMSSHSSLTLTDDQFCEVIDSQCVSSTTQIHDLDCGYQRMINIHRCVAFTTQNCYFNNNKCNLISGPSQYQQQLLEVLKCYQSNLKICNQITTPNQICFITQDNKCTEMYISFTDSCINLSKYDMNYYNPQLCRYANNPCYFDVLDNTCKEPLPIQQFKCNQIGASKKLCLQYTFENCVYQNYFCQNLTKLTIDCQFRNKNACLQGILSCYWNEINSACEQLYNDCPVKYEKFVNWQVCQSSKKSCFAGQNGCQTIFNQVPCWLSLSQSLCNYQKIYCQWIDNQCISKNYDCEDSYTKNLCLLHRSQLCVFHQNKCFKIQNISLYDCEQFDQVSSNFCRQFYPSCIYSVEDYKCIKINYLSKSLMIDYSLQQYKCSQLNQDIYACILQRSLKCTYYYYSWYKYCGSSNERDFCDDFNEIALTSIMSCEQFPNCNFGMTTKGQPFCYTAPLKCENLQSFCLKDIQGVHCFLDNNTKKCSTFVDELICENVQLYRVNKQLCLSIMKNPKNKSQCYYQEDTQYCKIINSVVKVVGNELILDYYVCLFQDISFLLRYDKNLGFQNCYQYSQGFDANLNLFGCIQLQDDAYYFDLNQFKCSKDITQPYIQVSLCHQMNKNACLKVQNHLSCIWMNDKCQIYQNQFINVSCQNRNYYSCINSVSQKCIWIQDLIQCMDSDNIINECENNSICEYSEYYCQSIGKLWKINECYEYTTELPISFFRCDRLGLNRDLCLNNTQRLTCYWNGFTCSDANLYLLECQDDVSQVTCSEIKTPKQTCKWINQKCQNIINSNQCDDFTTLQYCRQALISCQFNMSLQKCEQKLDHNQICSNTLSYKACQNVEYQFCQFDGYCNLWYRTRYSCENIVNYWGCMNTSMYCKWTGQCENIDVTFQPVLCNEIPTEFNKVSCQKYSIDPCLYDEIHKKCDMKLTSSFINSTNIDQSNYIQIRFIYECSQFIEKDDCIGSRIGYCEWQNKTCINCKSNNNSCHQNNCYNKSIKECLEMHELLCAWRNDQCIDWIFDMKNFNQSLVTMKCCQQMNSTVKYLESIQSCVQIDILKDQCNSLGLSKLACLSLVSQQCIYKNDKCLIYNFEYKKNCIEYNDINSQVCQQLAHLSCKYDQFQNTCVDVDYTQDGCLTQGLSSIGCSNITLMPCYWDIQLKQCLNFKVQVNVNQCDNQTITNSYSCRLLNYHQDVCSYNINKRTCQQKVNIFSKCSQPGLNRLACLKLIDEPCQYINNQCQKIITLINNCEDLRNVNELTCKMNIIDICIYDPIAGNCQQALSQYPCNYSGLNINNCKRQHSCQWIHDIQGCICLNQQIKSSCNLNERECINNCIYEQELQICRQKKCFDLTDCSDKVNDQICYQDQSNKCQGANKCEDIINLNDTQNCSDFMFDGSNCIQIMNYCISANNLQELCLNSNCLNTQCKQDNFTCRPLICSDYLEKEECQKISNCVFMNGFCQQIFTCSEIYDQELCIQTIVNDKYCSWEIYEIFDQNYHCTNNQCHLYRNSPSLCNGNEINYYSCYMNKFQQCQNCEDITDQCSCIEGCQFKNGKCQSILCLNFYTEIECQNTKKCYWSDRDKVCRKFCRFLILQEECQLLDYECHWNPYQFKCEEGVLEEIDLSVTLNQLSTYIQPLCNLILILLLFQ